MQLTRSRTLTSALALAFALAVPASACCQAADPGTLNLSSAAAAPSPLLMIAALLAFPTAMLAGVFVGRTRQSSPPGIE